ncbi:MAG: GAF domain-containing sensor histidine kinase [Thermodesulfobacteriota bacterium]
MTEQRKKKALRNAELIQLNKDLQKEIADLRLMENRLQATNELLNLFLRKSSRHEYLEAVVNLLYQWSECRGIGLRLIDNQGNIPYEAYRGFSSAFWKSENCLSLQNNQCLCSRIIQEKPLLEEAPFLTKAGSFCSNDLSSFMTRVSAINQNKYRGVCVRSGFNSLAIIPLRHQQKVLGAIHLADERQGCISSALLEFIETMAPLIGETVHRFNLEDELKNSEQRLRFLSVQLLTAQENERKRIARELHDSIGQSLAAIKFVLEKKISQLNSTANFPGIRLEDIVPMIQDTMEEIRRISMDLWPSILDDLGLLSGINYFCRQFGEIYSTIKIDKDLSVAEEAIPSSLKIVIYRILQEALNNIAKYSKANKVLVSLHKKNRHLELTIADNGIGFDYQSFPKGMGLVGMKERVELSGGNWALTSLPHKGTTIKASWLIS